VAPRFRLRRHRSVRAPFPSRLRNSRLRCPTKLEGAEICIGCEVYLSVFVTLLQSEVRGYRNPFHMQYREPGPEPETRLVFIIYQIQLPTEPSRIGRPPQAGEQAGGRDGPNRRN
jgi:hypothetical protein